ncbi:MAG: leucine-rich repeat domain-containing protein [Firmicutes bacterium]|nr:leucine-rich repeat domain-containing protein [Bacillota bacterium]
MRKRGFTLIELLAVIVILAIIAVIATPIITGIIEDSKKASFERSAEGVVEATKFDIPEKLTDSGYTYEFENGEIDLGENVKVNNAKNLSGTIKYNKDGEVSYAIHNDKWCVVKKNNETTTTEYEDGKCVLETSTVASAFTYIDNVESFEAGDNCVSYFQTNNYMSEENATKYCNNEKVYGSTLQEVLNKGAGNLEELKTNNVMKNVVMADAITITDYDMNIGGIDVVIPSTIDGKTVVAVGANAFKGKGIISVIIPNTITNIADAAFRDNQLTSVVIPNSVVEIGIGVFFNNQLTSVIIENGNADISCEVFGSNWSLETINIGGVDKSSSAVSRPCAET